ncbi:MULTISPECIES: MgtC/SapB family protein [Clostridium]|uniref:MgtC/SapB family protein n=1 Tax=Clostridium TaxID=1485 RepID=UPI00189ACD96|nr:MULTISPECIES: MgtC/SapB family protein [Clostridium]MCR1951433.1 MgtC/SapB family protein [Clostridium sp. DSM 100503]MDI9215212.1 MgtC/SapB family protein [Clostridium tertium]
MILDIREIIIRLVLAVIVGGIIGYEREMQHRAAGFRTHILVCLGATIISLLQIDMGNKAIAMIEANKELSDVIKIDYGRLGAQVITGVGFIGAGAIIHTKGNIKGLTTAATLWIVACLGLSIGMGEYYISIFGAIIIVITLVFLKRIESKFISKNIVKKVEIKYHDIENVNIEIQKSLENENLKIKIVEYLLDKEKNRYDESEVHAIYTIIQPGYVKLDKIIDVLRNNENIIYIKMLN